MDLPGRAGRLGDAQDRPRADGVPRNGPRADAGVHPAARFGVPIRAKKGKLAQMGRRVFGLKEGSEEEIARKAIEALVRFYEEDMGMKTHISTISVMNCK